MPTQWEKRVKLVEFIYCAEVSNFTNDQAIKKAMNEFEFDGDSMKIVEFYLHNEKNIAKYLSQFLTETWTWDRLPLFEKCVMIIAIIENKVWQTPKLVVIDQALVTIGNYSDSENKAFVNAILDRAING